MSESIQNRFGDGFTVGEGYREWTTERDGITWLHAEAWCTCDCGKIHLRTKREPVVTGRDTANGWIMVRFRVGLNRGTDRCKACKWEIHQGINHCPDGYCWKPYHHEGRCEPYVDHRQEADAFFRANPGKSFAVPNGGRPEGVPSAGPYERKRPL